MGRTPDAGCRRIAAPAQPGKRAKARLVRRADAVAIGVRIASILIEA